PASRAQWSVTPGSIPHLPDLHGVATTRGRQPFPVRAECHCAIAESLTAPALQDQQFSGISGIPHSGRPIRPGGRHPFAVWTERHTPNLVHVPGEGREFPAVAHVPDFRAVILTGGRDALAVRAERDAPDLAVV